MSRWNIEVTINGVSVLDMADDYMAGINPLTDEQQARCCLKQKCLMSFAAPSPEPSFMDFPDENDYEDIDYETPSEMAPCECAFCICGMPTVHGTCDDCLSGAHQG